MATAGVEGYHIRKDIQYICGLWENNLCIKKDYRLAGDTERKGMVEYKRINPGMSRTLRTTQIE